MKQRVRVAAICRDGREVLLLKRASGRIAGEAWLELPMGKIVFGEQPEEAMARILYEYLDLKVEKLNLVDVITFTNLGGTVELGNLFIIYEVALEKERAIKVNSERYGAYKWEQLSKVNEEATLGEEAAMVLRITEAKLGKTARTIRVKYDESGAPAQDRAASVYTDGGSRGNPGPSGVGYYILDKDGCELRRGGEFLGFSSSRLAEYYGLKEGIEQAIELGLKRVNFYSDSLMMVNQMNGVYKVKNKDLWQVHSDVLRLLGKLESYSFTHVPREKNREADAEVNRAIDEARRAG
ncbi:reverse transcriptase-like protein [Candidatus Saccharibacteria bacterium]|nr:reverse transcriptase-like protein [Candidatus Saccharibacteria bacterium]